MTGWGGTECVGAIREGEKPRRRIVTWEVVRPEGFEPPTNGFGSHYSIRLSYGRMPRGAMRRGSAFSHDCGCASRW
jgi:hypothetical protein